MQDVRNALAVARTAAALGQQDEVDSQLAALGAWSPAASAVARAKIALDRDDFAGALGELDGLTGVPASLHGIVAEALGNALVGLGQLDEAVRVADERLALDPGDLDAMTAKARALFRQRQVGPAEALLTQVLSQDPGHHEALFGQGVLYLATRRLDQAVASLRAAQKAYPFAPGPYRALAKLHLMTGQPGKGVSFLEGLLSRFPLVGSPQLLVELAELYAAAERTEGLRRLLPSLESASQLAPPHLVELGRFWFELGDGVQLRRLAVLAGQGADGDAAVAVLTGLALELEADPAGAHAQYAMAARLAPDMWLAHERTAATALTGARPDKVDIARRHVAEAQRLAPQTGEVRVTAALLQLATGQAAQAAETLQFAASFPGLRPSVRARARAALS